MNKKVTGVLAYLSLLGWLIAFLVGDKENAKFDLNQGLVLNLIVLVFGALGKIVSGFGFIFWIIDVVCFVFMIIGIVNVCKGEEKELPLIGSIKILK